MKAPADGLPARTRQITDLAVTAEQQIIRKTKPSGQVTRKVAK
jgi:hypothetical protein